MQRKLPVIVLLFLFSLALSAQTHFPIYSPSAKYSSAEDTDGSEGLSLQWNATLNELKQQAHASDKDFAAFLSYYQPTIDSARLDLYTKTQSGTNNLSIVKNYMNSQLQNLLALYNNFSNKYNNIQVPKVVPSYTAPTCDSACTNMDFSDGNLDGWYGYYATNNATTSVYSITGINGGALGAAVKGAYDPNTRTYQIHLTSSSNVDWFLKYYHGILLSQASPWGNGYSVMIGDSVKYSSPYSGQVAILSQEFEVTPNTNSITYAYAVILENPQNPPHAHPQQPFFSVTVFDQNGDTIKNCGEYDVYSGPGLPGFKPVVNPKGVNGPDTAFWKDWTQVNVPLTSYVGKCVTIQFEVSDCEPGGHFGYAYVDAACSKFSISANSPDGVICGKNGVITLNGPAGEKAYAWSGPKGGIVGNDTLANVNVDSFGIYKLIITPPTGSLCKDTLFYTVKNRDTISTTASIVTNIACNGGKGTAIAKPKNGWGAYTYAWSPGGQTTATATLPVGMDTVTVTDTNGCAVSAVVVLTQPTLLLAASNFTSATCGSNNGTATVTASGATPQYTYAWNPSGKTTATATGLSIGAYIVTVTDKNHCSVTSSVTITQPPVVTATISSVTPILCFGGNNGAATVKAGVGPSPYTYSWAPSGGNAATATGLTAGNYTVTVTDTNGCTATAKAVITQPTLLTATISATNNIPCNGGVGNATVTAAGGTSPYTYLWAPSGGTGATGTGLSVGSYTVGVADHDGCTATTSINITQPAVLAASITSTHAYCNLPNGTATVTVSGGTSAYTYAWTPSAGVGATATGLAVGTYSVNITDSHHCTTSVSVVITQPSAVTANITGITNVSCFNGGNGGITATASGGVPPYTYLWNPGGQTNATATSLFALTYTVKVTDADGCTTTDATTIVQAPAVEISILEPRTICKDSTGILLASVTGGSTPYTYNWSVGSTTSVAIVTPISTRTYSITVTDNKGCSSSAQITLQYGPSISLAIQGLTAICRGDSTTLCANVSGGTGGNVYTWGPSGNTNYCIRVSPTSNQLYTITVADYCGATATASTTVYATPAPVINFASNFSQGCAPFCVQFRNAVTIAHGKISQYIWIFGNGDTLLTPDPIYCYTSSGKYTVSLTAVSDSGGCSATLTKVDMISIYSHPNAAFAFSPQPTSILNPTIQFIDKSTDPNGGVAYWLWGFGDGSDSASNLPNPVHTYHDTGTFCANLLVMDNDGCTDTATDCVIIGPSYSLYIPSAFTPNGDGLNEVFKPVGEYIRNFDMYIFDRWGSEIYHTNDINNGWNGAVHGVGAICQEDIYIYKITVTDAADIQHSYIGNVSLLK